MIKIMDSPSLVEDGSVRTLMAGCGAGLSNRLRVLVSGLALAEEAGRRFRMLWPRTDNCAARFDQLFVNRWPVEESDLAEVRKLGDYSNVPLPLPDLLSDPTPHLTINWYSWMVIPQHYPGHEALMKRCEELFLSLELQPEIAARVAAFQQRFFRPRMIGVHLRRGDFRFHRPAASGNTRSAMEAVDALLAGWPEAGILLCTDDGAGFKKDGRPIGAEGVAEKFKQRYGERVVQTTSRSLDRNDPVAIEDAVLDLWLLRRTDAVVGTEASSFSQLAVFARQVPLTLTETSTWDYRLGERVFRATGLLYLMRQYVWWRMRRKMSYPTLMHYCRTRFQAGMKRLWRRQEGFARSNPTSFR